jgi:hypothetical protein
MNILIPPKYKAPWRAEHGDLSLVKRYPEMLPGLPPELDGLDLPRGAGGFPANTRRKVVRQPGLVYPAGGGLTEMQIQSTGLLSRIWLRVTATIAGPGAVPNPFGVSSILRRVRLIANSGQEIYSVSGPGYAWLLQDHLESEYGPATPQNQGRVAVVNGTYNLDMLIPVSVNFMDFTGLLLVQSRQIIVTLQVDWETEVAVNGAGTVITATATPYVEFYTLPASPEDAPDLTRAHVILQNDMAVPGAGEFVYQPIQTPVYLQLVHGLNYGVAGADDVDRVQLRVEQSNYIYDSWIDQLNMEWNTFHLGARPAGIWAFDFMASSGLGNYGGARDRLDTRSLTSFESVFNALGVGTVLTTIRRMIVDMQ